MGMRVVEARSCRAPPQADHLAERVRGRPSLRVRSNGNDDSVANGDRLGGRSRSIHCLDATIEQEQIARHATYLPENSGRTGENYRYMRSLLQHSRADFGLSSFLRCTRFCDGGSYGGTRHPGTHTWIDTRTWNRRCPRYAG